MKPLNHRTLLTSPLVRGIAALVAFLPACHPQVAPDTAALAGVIISEARPVPAFDRIAISGVVALTVGVGEAASVTLSGDSRVIPSVETVVRYGTLEIRGPKVGRRDEAVRVMVTMPVFRQLRAAITENIAVDLRGKEIEDLEIALFGVGNLELRNLVARRVRATLSGAGRLDLEGRVEDFDFELSGMGRGVFDNLCVQSATVRVNGMGNVTVNAAKALWAEVNGLGRVLYYGSPDLSPQLRGGGSIRYLDRGSNACPSERVRKVYRSAG